MNQHYEFPLEGLGVLGTSRVSLAVQHSGDPEQSTGIMFFGPGGQILFSLTGDGAAEMILGVLKRWRGKLPNKFQEIKASL